MGDDMRVLVVDDAVAYRTIVSRALEGVAGVEVVGVAADGKIALQKVENLHPDLLTLDVEMPSVNGIEVLRRLRASGSDVGVIMLSSFTSEGADVTLDALEMGAFDFVVKPSGGTPEANLEKLRRQLAIRIEAFSRAREISTILRTGGSGTRTALPTSTIAANTGQQGVAGNLASAMDHLAGMQKCEAVTIGISTGGPQALMHMLPQLPANLGVPVLIVQHMPPMFTRSLADDLNGRCALRVYEAADGQPVVPGVILIAPGGRQMKVERQDGATVIRITEDPPENSCRPSVDYLFRSVANVYGGRALAVLMTGMGNDGAAGCRLFHRIGAPILAQNEASCVVFGMPREPIIEGIAKPVPLENMAQEIVRIARHGGLATCK
ncbi:MAG: chemotaxis response regulator protein-glutamate methylesterase [Planctomycetaceae bacterium]|nr:chemotaxis response regulator protein-glutamate methylesterase [Planctomycetaceae bacterium]